jgi:U6 snRNA-associated Sm-like protein LSm4
MLPNTLLEAAKGHPILVELKTGGTFSGHLLLSDVWMNLHLREVVQTSREGDRFHRLAEIYIRGHNIKHIRLPDEVLAKVSKEDEERGKESRVTVPLPA